MWLHFIDNEAALATLVKGSSSVQSGEVITAFTHSLVAARGLWAWFDRVASADNPVDKLSRGELKGPWELRDIEFPPRLLDELRTYIGIAWAWLFFQLLVLNAWLAGWCCFFVCPWCCYRMAGFYLPKSTLVVCRHC